MYLRIITTRAKERFMEVFFSTWFSYFVILMAMLLIWTCFAFKTVNPYVVIGIHGYMGCIAPIAVVAISLFLAIISRYDPLGWLWADIARSATRFATENPHPLSRN